MRFTVSGFIKKRFNSILKKYAIGYGLIAFYLVVVLILNAYRNHYAFNCYHEVADGLVQVNSLEQACIELNGTINAAYNFLSMDAIKSCNDMLKVVENKLTILTTSERGFERQMEDMYQTIGTYLEESADFIEQIIEYSKEVDINDMHHNLQTSYNNLNLTYSYVSSCIQDVYSMKVNELHVLEMYLQKKIENLNIVLLVSMLFLLLFFTKYIRFVFGDIAFSIGVLDAGLKVIKSDAKEAMPICLNSNDEFEKLADSFNEMLLIIQKQMKRLEETASIKERLSKAENDYLRVNAALQKNNLEFLQSRINPHFLFNTLNTISSMASIEGADKTVELMEITASFLRYSLDNISKEVTLKKELRNLQQYIEIQNYRYDGRYVITVTVDESCLFQLMPSMVLQPLVENSIQHGVGMKKDGLVKITVNRNGNFLVLKVEDNGVGMEATRLHLLQREIKDNLSGDKHIGLQNIYRRLCLFYKAEIPFSIANLNPGLAVRFELPLYKEQKYVDNGDSR